MAAKYFINGGVDAKWSTSGNWASTDGGVHVAEVKPTASDDVHFTVNSPACTVDSASVGLSIDFTGYVSTITMTAGLTISGSVTLASGMTIAGASGLTVNAAATLTSAGKTWPNALSTTGAFTFTLADNWTVLGTVTLNTASSNTVFNGNTLNCSGSLTTAIGAATITGTTNLVMNGTGTLSMPSVNSGSIANNLEINTAGTITITGTIAYKTGIFKYTAGTVVATGSTLQLTAAATVTVNASGLTLGTFSTTAGAMTINGTNGFTMATLSSQNPNQTHTFTSGNTYTVTSSLILTGYNAQRITLAASTPSSAFNLNYTGTTMAVASVNATDVNSSGGSPIYDYGGTLLRTTNWTSGTTIASGAFSSTY